MTFALDFGDTAAEAVVGYILSFIILRMANLFFYRLLFIGQERKGWRRMLIVISFIVIYIGLHVAGVFVTLEMTDFDYQAWTIAFFVCILVDLIVWELIVAKWQNWAIGIIKKGQKPCCEF